MICRSCLHFRPLSQSQPIAPVCTWRPSPEVLEALLAILPAPHASCINIMYSPYRVEACGQHTEAQS